MMATTSKHGKISPGGFQQYLDRSPARQRFYQVIERQMPEVLSSLRADVLPLFLALRKRMGRPPSVSDEDLMVAVGEWAESHHLMPTGMLPSAEDLDDPSGDFFLRWLLPVAYGTLRTWSEKPPRPEQ